VKQNCIFFKLSKTQTVTAYKEQVSKEKFKQFNVTLKEAQEMSDMWEAMEMNRFMSALKPNSFREAKKAFDFCLETGKK